MTKRKKHRNKTRSKTDSFGIKNTYVPVKPKKWNEEKINNNPICGYIVLGFVFSMAIYSFWLLFSDETVRNTFGKVFLGQ